LCAFLGRGVLSLYGVAGTTILYASSIWCTSLVLGCLHYLLLLRDGSWLNYIIGHNLSKKGWLGFSLGLGFPRIKSCVFLCLFMLLISFSI
jgi:hypothetical protein